MKRTLLFLALVLVVTGSVVLWQKHSPSATLGVVAPVSREAPSPTGQVASGAFLPRTLRIPSIGVSAAVEYVGMDSQGRMAIPKNDVDVAWYQLGYRPGDVGNAVLAGHLDTKAGAPAVFWELSSLTPGDSIFLTDTNGSEHRFVVTQKATYPDSSFPLTTVFGPTEKKRLNLITCQGNWSQATHNYSDRTVIYSELRD